MNTEKTDQVISDTNELIPRVIYQGKVTLTTDTAAGTLYYGTASKTIDELVASYQFMVDAYILNSSQLTKLNFVTMPTGNQQGPQTENVSFYIDSDATKFRVNFIRYSRNNDESRTIYFVVYSTHITEEVIL
jgi:hypothetical protein